MKPTFQHTFHFSLNGNALYYKSENGMDLCQEEVERIFGVQKPEITVTLSNRRMPGAKRIRFSYPGKYPRWSYRGRTDLFSSNVNDAFLRENGKPTALYVKVT